MCAGCALTAASAATGFRTWLQTHRFGWLTPKRMRALTLAAMGAAAIVSTIGFSGSTVPAAHARPAAAPAGRTGATAASGAHARAAAAAHARSAVARAAAAR